MNTFVIRNKLLSVIVPTYKQPRTINRDLKNINRVLKASLQGIKYEIICVVDGEVDKTYKEAKKIRSPYIKVFSYSQNRGKGYAVRFGMARAKGDLISFLDAGMEISPVSITMLMAHMQWYNADVIVGSKRHPVSRVNYPLRRHIFSIGYHVLVKLLFGVSVKDTQSGIKVFKRKVIEKVLPRLLVKKYAMDIEMLAVANHLGFRRIYEAPIEVKFNKRTSRINWETIFRMMIDTLAVFYRLRVLSYYSDYNKKSWLTDPDLKFNISLR